MQLESTKKSPETFWGRRRSGSAIKAPIVDDAAGGPSRASGHGAQAIWAGTGSPCGSPARSSNYAPTRLFIDLASDQRYAAGLEHKRKWRSDEGSDCSGPSAVGSHPPR